MHMCIHVTLVQVCVGHFGKHADSSRTTPNDTASQGHQNYMNKLKFREKNDNRLLTTKGREALLVEGRIHKREEKAKNGYVV